MKISPKNVWPLLKTAASEWSEDKAPRLGAALAYYTIFSISPLLILVIAIVGFVFHNRDAAQQQIFNQVSGMVGEQGGKAIQALIVSADKPHQGIVATLIAIVTLIVGATGAFVQLQDALNSIWKVKTKPHQGVAVFITQRLMSFAMVMTIGFLLLVSLALTAGLSAASKYLTGFFPGWVILGQILNIVISFSVITLLFGMMFKILPDVRVRWRDVWLGAAWTGVLFTVGKAALGMYLGRSSVTSPYGAAGSLVVVLIWVYYSAQILFFGTEITKVHARMVKSPVTPKEHAIWISDSEAIGEPKAESPISKAIKTGKPATPIARPSALPAFSSNAAQAPSNGKHWAFPSLLLLLFVFVPLPKSKHHV